MKRIKMLAICISVFLCGALWEKGGNQSYYMVIAVCLMFWSLYEENQTEERK